MKAQPTQVFKVLTDGGPTLVALGNFLIWEEDLLWLRSKTHRTSHLSLYIIINRH